MTEKREPGSYCPTPKDLRILIGEAPRFTLLFGTIREGRATALEVARLVWPEIDLNEPNSWLGGLSPLAWVTDVLDHEAKSCQLGGAGLLRKEGDDYIRPGNDNTSCARPYHLPQWPRN